MAIKHEYQRILELLIESGRCSAQELTTYTEAELEAIAISTREYLETGESLILRPIESSDYEFEIPTVQTIIENPYYLGNELGYLEGGTQRQFYDFWMHQLKVIYEGPKKYKEICVTGGIGLGKTTFMNVIAIIDFMKVIALKHPQRHYNLMPSTKIVFMFFNILKELANDVGYAQFQSMLESSPFFREILFYNSKKSDGNRMEPHTEKRIYFRVGSRVAHALGLAVFGAQMDEANFGQDSYDAKTEENKSQVYKNYTTLLNRKESRFPSAAGHFLIGSSKKSEADFLEKHIKDNLSNPNTYVIDAAQYTVKKDMIDISTGKPFYSGKYFRVLLGDMTREPKIIEDSEVLSSELETKIERVPVEHRESFETNIVEALRDISGKSVMPAQAFFTNRESIRKAFDTKREAPWQYSSRGNSVPCTINLSYQGSDAIQDFLIREKLLTDNGQLPYRDKPRFISVDTGYAGDALGLGMGCKCGVRIIKREGKAFFLPEYYVDFYIRIKGKGKEHYPLYKTREFIKWLAQELKVQIGGFSTDGFQSIQLRQEIELAFPQAIVREVSVDKTDAYHLEFRNLLQNDCIRGLYHDKNLEVELFDLRHMPSGKRGTINEMMKMYVDHPKLASDGLVGRKDVSDALVAMLGMCKLDVSLSTEEIKEHIEEVKKIDIDSISKEADEAVARAMVQIDEMHLDDLFKK